MECPMNHPDRNCVEEKCAWWAEYYDDKGCALKLQAEALCKIKTALSVIAYSDK